MSELTLKANEACVAQITDFQKLLKDTQDKNSTNQSRFNSDLADWEKRKSVYEGYVSRWVAKTDEYTVWNKFDGKSHDFWAADNGTCWAGENRASANQWCKEVGDRKGLDGANYVVGSWGWCDGRYGNFSCVKPQEKQIQQQQDYQNVKPVFENADKPDIKNYGILELPTANIACCLNYMEAGRDNINNIQTCKQNLQQSVPAPGPAPVTSPTALNNNSIANLSQPLREPIETKYIAPSNDYSFVIFLVLILLIFSSSISLAVSGFLFLG
jgi:hypothetical protein